MMKITRNDVPEYLRKGAFFQTLEVTDSEEFHVPSDCFKLDMSVESTADLEFLLRSSRFWAVYKLPVDVVLFLINQECSLLTELSTNFAQYNNWWTMIGKLKSIPNEDIISTAIEVGFALSTIQSFHERGTFHLTSEACVAAASVGALDILTFLHDQQCPWDKETTNAAAENGSLECLTFAHKNGCALSKLCMILSAKKGSLECLQYLHQAGQTRPPTLPTIRPSERLFLGQSHDSSCCRERSLGVPEICLL